MGLYLLQVLDANGRTWLDPSAASAGASDISADGSRFQQRAQLETVHPRHAALQFGGLPVHLRHSALAEYPAVESAGTRRRQRSTSRSIPRSVSRPTPIGRTTSAKQPCRTSRRWSRWPFTISFAPRPALPSPPRSSGRLRGIQRNTIGNFWVDLVRVTYYLLLPICLVFAVFLVSQGMIQNFNGLHQGDVGGADESPGRKRKRQGRDD